MLLDWEYFLDLMWKLNSECNLETDHSKPQCHKGENTFLKKYITWWNVFYNLFCFQGYYCAVLCY